MVEVAFGLRPGAADPDDQAARHCYPATGNLPPIIVDGGDQLGVSDQQIGRRNSGCRHRDSIDTWYGSGGGARTHDNRINSAVLCQLSYPGSGKP